MKKNMQTVLDTLKNNWKVTVGVILAVIVIAFSVNALIKKEPTPVDTTPIEEVPVETPVAPARRRTTPTASVPTVTDNRTYTQLVAAYKNSTLQFNEECRVPIYPQTVYKVGSDVLLDNRGSGSIKITLGGVTHSLNGYGFKVVSLNTVGTFTVDCNSQQNVATITVQK